MDGSSGKGGQNRHDEGDIQDTGDEGGHGGAPERISPTLLQGPGQTGFLRKPRLFSGYGPP
jgi:hypothetical protein